MFDFDVRLFVNPQPNQEQNRRQFLLSVPKLQQPHWFAFFSALEHLPQNDLGLGVYIHRLREARKHLRWSPGTYIYAMATFTPSSWTDYSRKFLRDHGKAELPMISKIESTSGGIICCLAEMFLILTKHPGVVTDYEFLRLGKHGESMLQLERVLDMNEDISLLRRVAETLFSKSNQFVMELETIGAA